MNVSAESRHARPVGDIAMRRFVIAALAIAVLAAGTLVIARTAPVNDEQAAKEAHRAFVANLGKGDQKAIGAVLDRRFTWTDAEGRRADTARDILRSCPRSQPPIRGDSDVQTHFYGRMFTVRGPTTMRASCGYS